MQNLTVFFIDDDMDDREIFLYTLQNIDPSINCITSGNCIHALEKFNSDTAFIPSFIFLDLNMPLMSGTQFLAEIKKIPRIAHVPVIIYTTGNNPRDREETKKLGASYFLTKPNDLNKLANELENILSEKQNVF